MASAEDRETLRQSLEQHKQELRVAVQDLGTAARSWSDPTTSIRERPIPWLVGAFVLGLVVWPRQPGGDRWLRSGGCQCKNDKGA